MGNCRRLRGWAQSARRTYVGSHAKDFATDVERNLAPEAAIPIEPGRAPPSFVKGFESEGASLIRGVRFIDQDNIFPSASPSNFVMSRRVQLRSRLCFWIRRHWSLLLRTSVAVIRPATRAAAPPRRRNVAEELGAFVVFLIGEVAHDEGRWAGLVEAPHELSATRTE